MDQLPRFGKRELICLLSFTCNYLVFVWRGFLFLWVLGMGYVILLWHSLSLPYNYFLQYANMYVQYTAIFHGYKNDYFQMKNYNIFLIFAQNIDCGYTLEPPQLGGSNEYPQSMF